MIMKHLQENLILRHRLRDVAGFWDGARKLVAIVWDAHGWIWHG